MRCRSGLKRGVQVVGMIDGVLAKGVEHETEITCVHVARSQYTTKGG